LGFTPWSGRNGRKGQLELFRDIENSVKRQLAGDTTAPQIFRVESCHSVGKTYGAAGLVNWFFDSFSPAIIITTAPTDDQVDKLLWKDIRTQRKHDTGQLKPSAPEMSYAPNHFALGRVTNNNNNQGSAKAQGQHGEYMMFVFDEAEGIPQFMYDAVGGMMTGGKVLIWLLIANPQTTSSPFHKLGKRNDVQNYRFDALDFPNVIEDETIIPGGAASRRWVDERIDWWCERVSQHNDDEFTFEVPWRLDEKGKPVIWKPVDPEFLWRVRGIPPKTSSSMAFISSGRYEAARYRNEPLVKSRVFQLGMDAARYGVDRGTLYGLLNGRLRKYATISKQDGLAYAEAVIHALETEEGNFDSVSLRVDGTGGFASGGVDLLNHADQFITFRNYEPVVHEVHFASSAHDEEKYKFIVTEMYAEAAETLKGIVLECHSNELEEDLTGRLYKYVNVEGKSVKVLEDKDIFRKRHKSSEMPSGRSPDDGDGVVLALAPEHIFQATYQTPDYTSRSYSAVR
jgi:hypothetical protein